jgi:pyruvate formate lyase activating enzyme
MAAAGCNMDCLYCQNYELAQSAPDRVKSVDFDPARALGGHQFKTLTFTYTDAICQPEYVFELSKIARKYGVKTVLCTGAYVNPGPLAEFVKRVDAFAVTLKASDEASYKSLTGVRLAPVLDAIRQIKESGRWLELITLIVPGYNDELKGLAWLANWIRSELGADTPWHLSRFVPEYKLRKLPPTPRRTLEDARKAGLEAGLKYVYITNLAPHEGNNTYCPKCGKAVLERLGFKLMAKKLSSDGKCPFCGASLPGVWS